MLTFKNPKFKEVAGLEWLATNGLGGYASSTVAGANTRRYHGLLVSALQPPTGRTVMVSRIEEAITLDHEEAAELSANRYPGVIHPHGYRYLESFDRHPVPAFRYQVKDRRLTKRVLMVHGSNTTVVEYENSGDKPFHLNLTPLFVHRDYHSLQREDKYFDYYLEWKNNRAAVIYSHYGAPALFFTFSKGKFRADRKWYRNFEYEKEEYRGLDFREDSYCLGTIECQLEVGEKVFITFSTEEKMAEALPEGLVAGELARLEGLRPVPNGDPFFADLAAAADQFLVWRASSNSHSLIAGYHWFTDWGRDTMIAMRGICIALGKKETSESILETFLKYLDGGMLPNRFPDQGEAPEYNTIDATLWLFIVLYEYYKKFRDLSFISRVFPDLTAIIEAHIRGTRYGIHTTGEGLLFGGEGNVQLTWMDARVGDYVVTPRHGCPVEINALWYNALMIYNHFAKLTGKEDRRFEELAGQVKVNFKKYFLNEFGYLNDVVIPGDYVDKAIRPNQIYAISLPFPLLSGNEEKKILDIVSEYLYTGLGLRTLNREHPDFRGLYGGDQWQRDTAYHQGTVWPFLIGEYWLAYLKVHRHSAKALNEVKEMMAPLRRHFYGSDGIHGISEIFDGGEPGPGRGCIQQAWSVGMLLMVLEELEKEKMKTSSKSRKKTFAGS